MTIYADQVAILRHKIDNVVKQIFSVTKFKKYIYINKKDPIIDVFREFN